MLLAEEGGELREVRLHGRGVGRGVGRGLGLRETAVLEDDGGGVEGKVMVGGGEDEGPFTVVVVAG